MIISHKHRYLFVELPHTASTAISRELCRHYDGENILHKHALPFELTGRLDSVKKDYLIFAGIRNPADILVTQYFKKKTNHQGFFSDPQYWEANGGHVSRRELRQARFILENSASFSQFFLKFFLLPYDSYGCPAHEDFDLILRYENLQEDFSLVLKVLRLSPVRAIPRVNPTADKSADFWSYFDTPASQKRARWVLGPYMRLWDYSFPQSWSAAPIAATSTFLFRLMRTIRRRLIWHDGNAAGVFRRIRHLRRVHL